MNIFYALLRRIRAAAWAILVAYMLGWHNFYKGDDKTMQNIGKIEIRESQDDNAPKC